MGKVPHGKQQFWTKNHQKLLVDRISYVKNKIPDVYESVIASIDDEFNVYKKLDPNFIERENKFIDGKGKTVKCKAYLDLLNKYVEENDELMENALKTALAEKWIS